MGIKWDNISVLHCAITNNMVLGKTDKSGRIATDKSGDRTNEIITATMHYMDNELKRSNGDSTDKFAITCEAGRLIWEPKEAEREARQ